jgi:hypothetical protein
MRWCFAAAEEFLIIFLSLTEFNDENTVLERKILFST